MIKKIVDLPVESAVKGISVFYVAHVADICSEVQGNCTLTGHTFIRARFLWSRKLSMCFSGMSSLHFGSMHAVNTATKTQRQANSDTSQASTLLYSGQQRAYNKVHPKHVPGWYPFHTSNETDLKSVTRAIPDAATVIVFV